MKIGAYKTIILLTVLYGFKMSENDVFREMREYKKSWSKRKMKDIACFLILVGLAWHVASIERERRRQFCEKTH
jgi:hypothetical protein